MKSRVQPIQRRGAAVVAIIIAMLVMGLVLIGMVLGGARDQDLNVQRMNTLRAFYASEAGVNMGVREVMRNYDEDGDGGIGSISNDGNSGNDPALGNARVVVSTSSPSQGKLLLNSVGTAAQATRDVTTLLTAANGSFGYGTPFGSQQQSVANKQIATRVNIPQPVTLLSMTTYLNGPSPKLTRYGVYTDSAGEPNTLVTQTYNEAVGGDSSHFHWLTLFLPSTNVSTGNYWLAIGFENTSMEYMYDSVGGQTRYNNNDPVASGFNTPWGASSASTTRRINVYATAATATTGLLTISGPSDYDNNDPPLGGKFRDLTNPTKIVQGSDISANAVKYTAMNFTAASGLVSDCMTAYDTTPTTASQTDFQGSLRVSADVLFTGTGAIRWAGLAALHNEVSGQAGMALTLKDNGNSDRLEIVRLPANGDISGAAALATSSNFNNITENSWYRLVMDVTVAGNTVQIDGRVYSHATANNPTSLVNPTPLQTITYSNTTTVLTGLQTTGEVAFCFDTTDASSRGSITNVQIDSAIGTTISTSVNSWAEINPH